MGALSSGVGGELALAGPDGQRGGLGRRAGGTSARGTPAGRTGLGRRARSRRAPGGRGLGGGKADRGQRRGAKLPERRLGSLAQLPKPQLAARRDLAATPPSLLQPVPTLLGVGDEVDGQRGGADSGVKGLLEHLHLLVPRLIPIPRRLSARFL